MFSDVTSHIKDRLIARRELCYIVDIFAGHMPLTPADVSEWTATITLMGTATSLRQTAARTTPTVSATGTTRRPTLTKRVSTSTAVMSTMFATIILPHVTVTGTMDSVITEGPILIIEVVVVT